MKLEYLAFVIALVMKENGSAQQLSMETWMRDLPAPLKDVPLIYLAIPGSHDSMTYGIVRNNGIAPDADQALRGLYPLFQGTILRWTRTQDLDAYQQLAAGIRYLDLRVTTKTGSDLFFFCHSMYAGEISQGLEQVRDYVDTHPGEVVILDFQHFYNLTQNDHLRLIRYLLNLYGRRIVPKNVDLQRLTLNYLQSVRQQIIIVYNKEFLTDEFWSRSMLPTPWPNQTGVSGLLAYLNAVKRNPATGFVHQAVLTPSPDFIVLRFLSTLRAKCAMPVIKQVLPVLAEFSPGRPVQPPTMRAPVNVVIADFIDINNAIFPKTIVQLNFKLIQNTDLVRHNYGNWLVNGTAFLDSSHSKKSVFIDLLRTWLLIYFQYVR